MVIRNFREQETVQNPHGIKSYKLHDSVDAVIMHLELMPKEQLKPHITPVNVLFYVLEGTPDILIGDERKTVKPDDIIESPKDIVHCIYNESDSNVRVLVMKVPKPVTPTKFVN